MILSDTINIRYKYNTCGMNTVEMAQLLKYYGFRGFLKSVNSRSFIVAMLPKDKAHNIKVMDEIKGIMGSENKKAMSENHPKIAVIKGAV